MKKLFMFMLLFATIVSVSGQTTFGNNKVWDNWSIGTDGGITTNLHDWDTPNGGVWGVQITKGISPKFAVELSSQLGFNSNANWNIPHSASDVDNLNVLASLKANLTNIIWGYKGTPRLFEVNARGGVGYQWGFYDGVDNNINSGVAKLGLDFDFNLGKEKAWTVSVKPAVILRTENGKALCDNTPMCTAYSHNAVGQLTVGVTYHFKGSNGKHHYTAVAPTVVTKVVEKIVEKPIEKVIVKEVNTTNAVAAVVNEVIVPFTFNSSVLTDNAKSILDGINANNVSVKGGATFEPSSNKTYNKKLSEARAKTVADYLKAKGINVISIDGVGDELDAKIVVVTLN